MKYKVGDYVRIKSLDWYNKNKDNYGAIYAGNGFCFWKNMTRHCGEIMKITTVKVDPEDSNKGFYFMKNSDEKWTDGMIEGLVEEKTLIERFDDNGLPFNEWLSHKGAFHIPDGYELKDENGNVIPATKIVLEKKKKSYPKTYDEAFDMLGYRCDHIMITNPPKDASQITKQEQRFMLLTIQFQKLLTCRDAYWKIAGEEMGLGKPWKPDWLDDDTKKYVITSTKVFETFGGLGYINYILTFPTKEMRDAFYENFKELIEQCKELL